MNYKNLKLDKSMYRVKGKDFTTVLEELDPSENYQNTSLAGLDAFGRQLKRFDIKVSGVGSDAVEKFFSTVESSALFPEYVKRAVIQGMEEKTVINDIIATKTKIDSMDYRSITSTLTKDDKSLKKVTEGSSLPVTEIKSKSRLVKLSKHGRLLTASYEALRYQKLDLFTVTLKQIGAHISYNQIKDAVDVLMWGDNRDEPDDNNAMIEIVKNGDPLTYNDFLEMWHKFTEFELNTMLVSPATMMEILNIEEFRDPATGLNFQGTGKLSTPIGANLIRSSAVPDNYVIGFDKNCALEMVVAGDVLLEYDKLIDNQIERAAISCISGFSKIHKDSCVAINTQY